MENTKEPGEVPPEQETGDSSDQTSVKAVSGKQVAVSVVAGGRWDRISFYATVLFSLVAIGSFFVFLFMVPFVIEPAVTTIQMDFPVDPVTCCTISFRNTSGAENCSDWSSCREGCTRNIFSCVKIKVAYTDAANFSCQSRPRNHQWLFDDAFLYPNVKGCGYPPALNCTLFGNTYRQLNTTFPCHYSRVDPTLVITSLDPQANRTGLILAFVVPFVCFIISIIFLTYAYHRMLRRRMEDEARTALVENMVAESPQKKSPEHIESFPTLASRVIAPMTCVMTSKTEACEEKPTTILETQLFESAKHQEPPLLGAVRRASLLPPLTTAGSTTAVCIHDPASSTSEEALRALKRRSLPPYSSAMIADQLVNSGSWMLDAAEPPDQLATRPILSDPSSGGHSSGTRCDPERILPGDSGRRVDGKHAAPRMVRQKRVPSADSLVG